MEQLTNTQQDNSDAQYHSFRNNLPLLSLAALIHLSAKFLFTRLTPKNLIPFTLFFSILAITGLHGANILKLVIILYINYTIAKRIGSSPKLGPILTWTFNVAILFLNDMYDGYQFASLSKHLSFLVRLLPTQAFIKDFLMSISRITYSRVHTLVGT